MAESLRSMRIDDGDKTSIVEEASFGAAASGGVSRAKGHGYVRSQACGRKLCAMENVSRTGGNPVGGQRRDRRCHTGHGEGGGTYSRHGGDGGQGRMIRK